MRMLASSQFASVNTVLTHTGHVLREAEQTQYDIHIDKDMCRDMKTHASTKYSYAYKNDTKLYTLVQKQLHTFSKTVSH